MYHVGADHHAAIMSTNITAKGDLAGIGVDTEQHQMRLKRMAWVHLNTAIRGWQLSASGHLPHKFLLQAWLHVSRQQMKFAVCNFHQGIPSHQLALVCTVKHLPICVQQIVNRTLQLVGRNGQQFGADFFGSTSCCPTQHDGHSTPNRAIGRQCI